MNFATDQELITHYEKVLSDKLNFPVVLCETMNTPVTGFYYMKYSTAALCRVQSKTNEIIAEFRLTEFPGCCAFMVSFHGSVSYKWQKLGLGAILNQMRIDIARLLGYTALVCTDKLDNVGQRKILAKNGWKDIFTCVNKRTNNKIAISLVEL